jgi:hypothetical protein
MVKFVCFYLRILADEEVRILQYRQEQASQQAQQAQQAQQTQQAEIADSESDVLHSDESTAGGSDEESDSSTQPRRRQRKQDKTTHPDMMKDARELCIIGECLSPRLVKLHFVSVQ